MTRVLVVEDDPDTREALMATLRTRGYEVDGVEGGREALDRMREAALPALVLLDLMLPGMDGFEFRLHQTEDPALAPVPVVVLSAGVDLPRKAARLAPDACLTKPVDPTLLLEVVDRLCAAGRRARQSRRAPTRARRRRSE